MNGKVISQLQGEVNVILQDSVPLELVKTVPANNSDNYEPDQFLQLNFSRPIDISKLQVKVERTLHGLSYANNDEPGVDFLHAKGSQLTEINVDREVVPGGISLLPKDSSIVFYPTENVGYNAEVYWTVLYDGNELGKGIFKTRGLPTLVDGGIKDALGQTVSGVTLELEELNLVTITNKDGAYNFGYQMSAEQNIAGGEYTLLINRDRKAPNLGEIRVSVEIIGGRRNQLNLIRIPVVDTNINFTHVPAGNQVVKLVGGDIEINLNDSFLNFPDEKNRSVHAQFVPAIGAVRPKAAGSIPLWFYQLQPFGIKPTKAIELKINVPMLNGSYDYLLVEPGETKYAFLLGYKDTQRVIAPVAVVSIKNGVMETLEPVKLDNLDYLGYSHSNIEHQEYFKQFVEGKITFVELQAQVMEQ